MQLDDWSKIDIQNENGKVPDLQANKELCYHRETN